MFTVTATHHQAERTFGPVPTDQEARDWIIRHSEHLTNARVRHMQGASTMPPCHICGNTTGPCEHMSAHLYPEDDMNTTTKRFPTMIEINSTAVHHRACYDYCHECGRLHYVRNVHKCRDCTQRDADTQAAAFNARRGRRDD
jgi:hypothetical protein